MDGVVDSRVHALAQRDDDVGRAVARAVERCTAPLRVQVSGRSGVGKSMVRTVLTSHRSSRIEDLEIDEAPSIDVPRAQDPVLDGDVVVHVLAGGAHRADVDAVRARPNVVVVLAKADTVDDVQSALAELSTKMGVPVHPFVGTVATSVLAGLPADFESVRQSAGDLTPDVLLTPERFLRADIAMSPRDRLDLMQRIETLGVGAVAGVLRADPSTDDAALRLLLTELSGMDGVAQAVRTAVEKVCVDRQGRLLHRLTELCALHPEDAAAIEVYLGSDEAVIAIMRSALRALGEEEVSAPTLRTVQDWQGRFRDAVDPAHARAALAVSRGYLRLRTR